MINEITKKILKGGEAVLGDFLGRAESFELEFKMKDDPSNHELSKTDKRNLGKALSGFSNAEGGLVIYGIATKQIDHLDTAYALRPIAKIERFKSEVDGRLGELLLPANPSIATYAVSCAEDSDRGYLLIDIGRSDLRPHMSMAPDHQKYFRRSVGGTLPMDHGLVRDLMMAPKEARIEPIWRIETQSSTGGNPRIFRGSLDLYLANVGRSMVAMPYALISMNPRLTPTAANPAATMDARPDSSIAYYGTRDSVIHHSDEVRFGSFEIAMTVNFDVFQKALDNGDAAHAAAPEVWGFGRRYDMALSKFTHEIDVLKIVTIIGAENAQSREHRFDLSKKWFIEHALTNNLLRVEQIKAEALARAFEAIKGMSSSN